MTRLAVGIIKYQGTSAGKAVINLLTFWKRTSASLRASQEPGPDLCSGCSYIWDLTHSDHNMNNPVINQPVFLLREIKTQSGLLVLTHFQVQLYPPNQYYISRQLFVLLFTPTSTMEWQNWPPHPYDFWQRSRAHEFSGMFIAPCTPALFLSHAWQLCPV